MKMLIDLHAYLGEAVVAGYNVKSATEMVKKSRLYEPKFSMYDDLTVKRISLFGGIYGLPS
jgi:ABC-type multidrug transport system ATPase subunit